ncbi:hypothetical protein PGT21_030496 [Puccinia graminis f. sp. tritici]|uniref:Secreted protein n=1 Tax=Puccinia graminis f. sp. tritici TaxID=56615 RepID=A0A5B0QC87_PUCGR|nr:hypothetical protein PGT21_030496 [Puccinia graminis f. sp. tritici]
MLGCTVATSTLFALSVSRSHSSPPYPGPQVIPRSWFFEVSSVFNLSCLHPFNECTGRLKPLSASR